MRLPPGWMVGAASPESSRGTAVDESFQNVLLDIEVVVGDRLQPLTQFGQVLYGLFNSVIIDIVGRRFSPQKQMIAHVLFNEAVAIMATDHRIGQLDILDDRLEFAFVVFGDLTAKDYGNFVGLADGAIGIQEPLSKLIERRSAMKNQVVAIFHLGKEKPVLATGTVTFALFEKRSQIGEPFLATAQKIVCGQRIGQLLKLFWPTASEERVGTLPKIDGLFAHSIKCPWQKRSSA
jgi:hypothetical protein